MNKADILSLFTTKKKAGNNATKQSEARKRAEIVAGERLSEIAPEELTEAQTATLQKVIDAMKAHNLRRSSLDALSKKSVAEVVDMLRGLAEAVTEAESDGMIELAVCLYLSPKTEAEA